MARPVMLSLVVASRFGLLLGLSLWLGLGVAAVLAFPVVQRHLAPEQAGEVLSALRARVDALLLLAMVLVVVALGARVVLDRAAPPGSLVLPIAAMVISRLIASLALAPALRAWRPRLRDANAPATNAERSAFARLYGAASLLLTLEVCLGLYALFAVS